MNRQELENKYIMSIIKRMYVRFWMQNKWFFRQICKVISHDWYDLGPSNEICKNRYICLRCAVGGDESDIDNESSCLSRLLRIKNIRKIALKLPEWDWLLNNLYPDNCIVEFKKRNV